MIKTFFKWLSKLFKKDILYKVLYTSDVPHVLNSKFIYIIQNEGYSWQAAMICPCGCKKILYMNLMKDHHPSWKVELGKSKIVTIYPSINRIVGCKSHFFVRKGKIVWA